MGKKYDVVALGELLIDFTDAVEAIQSVLPYADMLKISDEESVLPCRADEE